MLNPKNNAAFLRDAVLTCIAKSFLQHDLEDINEASESLLSGKVMRGSAERDLAVIKEMCIAALGYTPCKTDVSADLKEFALKAKARSRPEAAEISVMPHACEACTKLRYTVTEMCRGCFARPCELNCPKKAITVEKQAHINQDLCIKCGICYNNCPYSAINKAPLPCEDACPVGAISKDENGFEHIDYDKCIFCGKCLLSCPFGAVVHNSQLIDVLNVLRDKSKKKVAMLAPAVIGQFGNDLGKVITAFKKLGFDEVVEVAEGADVTTATEAKEFIERMQKGEKFMTTSCCPAWVAAAEKHIPQIKPFVSDSGSPMYYIAEIVKKRYPDCVSVFVGPCLAKRNEAEKNPNVDYVWIFEEAQAAFAAAGINVAAMEEGAFETAASAQGRRYPVSGGVAGAVQFVVDGKADYKPERINGLNPEEIKKLKRYAVCPPADVNMIEVMCCEGGCIGGPGTMCPAKKGAVLVENYVKTSADMKK